MPAPWKSAVSAALHRNRSDKGVRFLQLATVDAAGQPDNRTVVFRGFWQETELWQLAVDQRSEKIPQLLTQPQVALCWYFSKTREQFRVRGTSMVVDAAATGWQQTARSALWQTMSARGKLLWFWPEPRGVRAAPEDFCTELPPDADEPPATFVLMLVEPQIIDHLQLRGEPQDRHIYEREGEKWQVTAVNP